MVRIRKAQISLLCSTGGESTQYNKNSLLGNGSPPFTKRPPPSRGPVGEGEGAPAVRKRAKSDLSAGGHQEERPGGGGIGDRPRSTEMQERPLQREGHSRAGSIVTVSPRGPRNQPGFQKTDPTDAGVRPRRHFRCAVGQTGRIRGVHRRGPVRARGHPLPSLALTLQEAPARKGCLSKGTSGYCFPPIPALERGGRCGGET